MHILNSSRISVEKLEEAKQYLFSFAEDFEHLYGESNMVFNVHMIRHLPDCVKFLGPLWAYSNYYFEDHIGHMVSLHKGTTDVATQICEKYLLEKNLFQHFEQSPIAYEFFQSIDSKQKCKVSRKVAGSLIMGNVNRQSSLNDVERSLIFNHLNLPSDAKIDEYSSVLLNGKIFYEKKVLPNKRTNDSFIFNTQSRKFGEIKAIFIIHEKIYFFVNETFDMADDYENDCPFIFNLRYSELPDQKIVESKYIGPKFAFVKFNNTIACSKFPNMYERN